MPFLLRQQRRLAAGFAALIVAALSHCSWEDARELVKRAEASAPRQLWLPRPIQQPAHDCAHESGCICRGATLVAAVSAAHYRPAATGVLLAAGDFVHCDAAMDSAAVALPGTIADRFFPPPLFGRQLRARYASLLI